MPGPLHRIALQFKGEVASAKFLRNRILPSSGNVTELFVRQVIDLILLNSALRVLDGNLNPFVSSFDIKHASDFVAGHVTNYYPRNV